MRGARAPVKCPGRAEAEQPAEDRGAQHQPYERHAGAAEQPADLDVRRIRPGERDQEADDGNGQNRVGVQARPVGLAAAVPGSRVIGASPEGGPVIASGITAGAGGSTGVMRVVDSMVADLLRVNEGSLQGPLEEYMITIA